MLKCYYFLLQIAHMILQLLEKSSLRNFACRLLECLRYRLIPAEAFADNSRIQIRLDSS